MRIKPIADHILIEAAESENKTKSGIVLPDSVEGKKLIKGTVIAVGPGRVNDKGERTPVSVKAGDTVLFRKPYSAEELEDNGKKYMIVEESDIIGTIEQ